VSSGHIPRPLLMVDHMLAGGCDTVPMAACHLPVQPGHETSRTLLLAKFSLPGEGLGVEGECDAELATLRDSATEPAWRDAVRLVDVQPEDLGPLVGQLNPSS